VLGGENVGPERRRRASDPSLEEMLRRARDARLGDDFDDFTTSGTDMPRFTPFPATGHRGHHDRRWRDRMLLVIGMGLCLLGGYTAAQVCTIASDIASWEQASFQTTTAAPTVTPAIPTDTPFLAPTDVPTATPDLNSPSLLTPDEITALAQDYYDNQGPFAGTYVMMDGPQIYIQGQDESQLTVCIVYDYAPVSSPDTIAGNDSRTLTLSPASDGSWQVVELGAHASCSLG
jgi:hypothetical protein